MDPATMMAAGTGAQLLLSLIGEAQAAGDNEEALRLMKQLMAEYDSLDVPELANVEAQQMGPSALGGVQTDPALRAAQLESLDELQRVSRSGGLTLEDQANLADIRTRTGIQEKGGRERIREDMAMRGTGGSGAELAMMLQNQQGAANRASREGLETAGMAQKRALDAMLSRGRLAGDVRGQDYGEKARAAEAADAIARYNAQSREKAGYYNAGLPAQQYQMEMAKLNAKRGATGDVADMYGQQADRTRQLWSGFGAAANQGANAYAGYKKGGR